MKSEITPTNIQQKSEVYSPESMGNPPAHLKAVTGINTTSHKMHLILENGNIHSKHSNLILDGESPPVGSGGEGAKE